MIYEQTNSCVRINVHSIYICVYIYIMCIYICMCIYIYICMYSYVCICVYMYTCIAHIDPSGYCVVCVDGMLNTMLKWRPPPGSGEGKGILSGPGPLTHERRFKQHGPREVRCT